MDCLFCRIAAGEIPASIVYQDDDLVAFNDINPQAPMHVLIVPRKHIPTTSDISEGYEELVRTLVGALTCVNSLPPPQPPSGRVPPQQRYCIAGRRFRTRPATDRAAPAASG